MISSPQTRQQVNKPLDSYFKNKKCLFRSNPDSQGVNPDIPTGNTFYKPALLGKKVIFLERPSQSKKNSKTLWAFDLEKMQWSSIKVKGSPILSDNKEDYSVCTTQDDQIILCGSTRPVYISKIKF